MPNFSTVRGRFGPPSPAVLAEVGARATQEMEASLRHIYNGEPVPTELATLPLPTEEENAALNEQLATDRERFAVTPEVVDPPALIKPKIVTPSEEESAPPTTGDATAHSTLAPDPLDAPNPGPPKLKSEELEPVSPRQVGGSRVARRSLTDGYSLVFGTVPLSFLDASLITKLGRHLVPVDKKYSAIVDPFFASRKFGMGISALYKKRIVALVGGQPVTFDTSASYLKNHPTDLAKLCHVLDRYQPTTDCVKPTAFVHVQEGELTQFDLPPAICNMLSYMNAPLNCFLSVKSSVADPGTWLERAVGRESPMNRLLSASVRSERADERSYFSEGEPSPH